MELFWNFLELFGSFGRFSLEFFWNSFGILLEFFGNSLGILLELFGDVWLGGSECLGVDLRLNGRQGQGKRSLEARGGLSRA